jgi:tripartite-type tricarboxylate transporter receptor subunit TctC
MQAVARAAPDGYTFLFALTSLSINPHLYRLAFDPLTDFAPVALVGRQPFVLVGRPSLAAGSPAALLAELKALPNPVTCAHSGGVTLIGCELLRSLGGLSITLIPYRGNLEAIARLSAGDVDILFDPVSSAYANTRAGRVKAFGATDPGLPAAPFERLPALAAALPGFELASWYGILAPAATARPIIERVNREAAAVLARPDLRKALAADGIHTEPGTPEAFAEFLRREHARHGRVIRAAGIPIQE